MMRLGAMILVAIVVAVPLSVRPGPPVTWLAVLALVVGGTGALALSVALVTAAGALGLIAYTLALAIARPAVDPIAAIVLGAALVLLLTLAHIASRVQGAALGPPVIASQVRQWLTIVVIGVVAAAVLTAAAAGLGLALLGATLPVVVVAGALGAVATVAGLIALVAPSRDLPGPADR
jgi:hypothetical protein